MKYLLAVFLCFFALNVYAWSLGDGDDITTLKTRTKNIVDDTKLIEPRTAGLKLRTENTLNKIQEISDTFRASLAVLSPELSDRIRDGLVDINKLLAMQREGLDEFLGPGVTTEPLPNDPKNFNFDPIDRSGECLFGSLCFQFREDLKFILTDIKQLTYDTVSAFPHPGVVPTEPPDPSLDLFIDLIDRVPGRVLYPLYKTLVDGGPDLIVELRDMLTQAKVDFENLRTIITEDISAYTDVQNEEFPQIQYEAKGCQKVILTYPALVRAKQGIQALSFVLASNGNKFEVVGSTALAIPDVSGGFAEFLDIEIEVKTDTTIAVGKGMSGLAEKLKMAHEFIDNKIDYCTNLRAQLNILDNQNEILRLLRDHQASIGSTDTVVADAGEPTGGGGAIGLWSLFGLWSLMVVFRRQYRMG